MKDILYLFAIIILLILAISFFNKEPEIIIKTETITNTIVKTDTVTVEEYVDRFIEVPIATPTVEDSLNRYDNTFTDEYINATITSWTTGILKRQTLDYTFKKETTTIRDSIFVNTTTTITHTNIIRPNGLFFGVEASPTNLSPKLMFVSNTGFAVSYRHDFRRETSPYNVSLLIKF
jgi:hypothetical protein